MARTLGNELKKVRELRGLSLHSAARPAGVSATYLQKLERDQVASPSPRRLHRLAEVPGIDYRELLRLVGYPLPDGDGATVGVESPGAPPEPGRASLLRQMLVSEEEVTDEEIEELVRYLRFIREQAPQG